MLFGLCSDANVKSAMQTYRLMIVVPVDYANSALTSVPHQNSIMSTVRSIRYASTRTSHSHGTIIRLICLITYMTISSRCRPGYADISESFNRLPGRRCVEAVNECVDASKNDCAEHALCEDAKEGYTW